MFAYFRFPRPEFTEEELQYNSEEQLVIANARGFHHIAETLVTLYAARREEYRRFTEEQAVATHQVIKVALLGEDQEILGVAFDKHDCVVFVNVSALPDDHLLQELAYLYEQEPATIDSDLEWEDCF